MSLKGKFKIMVMVSVAGLLGVAGFWIKNQHSSMLTEKLQKSKNLVEVPYSVIEKQYQNWKQRERSAAKRLNGAPSRPSGPCVMRGATISGSMTSIRR